MPKPKDRSRSVRKVAKKTPGGKNVIHYSRRKKGKKHVCALTHEPLRGVDSSQGIAKSKRTPSRKFGGHLSPLATKKVLVYVNRVRHGLMKLDDVEIKYRKYVESQLKG